MWTLIYTIIVAGTPITYTVRVPTLAACQVGAAQSALLDIPAMCSRGKHT